MGFHNDYAGDVNQEDANIDTSDDEVEEPLDPQAWQDWNSEHLLNMYMSLVDYCETQGLPFMCNVSFNQFNHFILNRC